MAIIIDFKEKLKEKIESKKISLSTFKLTEEDVDIIKLYHYIDEKYKIKLTNKRYRGDNNGKMYM